MSSTTTAACSGASTDERDGGAVRRAAWRKIFSKPEEERPRGPIQQQDPSLDSEPGFRGRNGRKGARLDGVVHPPTRKRTRNPVMTSTLLKSNPCASLTHGTVHLGPAGSGEPATFLHDAMVTARVLASIDGGRHVVLMNNGRRVKVRLQSDEPGGMGRCTSSSPSKARSGQ